MEELIRTFLEKKKENKEIKVDILVNQEMEEQSKKQQEVIEGIVFLK